jgi:hypothetical protein
MKKQYRITTNVCGFKLFGSEFHWFCPHQTEWFNNRQVVRYEYSRAFEFRQNIGFLESLLIPAGREDYLIQTTAKYPEKRWYRFGRIATISKGRREPFVPNGTLIGLGRMNFNI